MAVCSSPGCTAGAGSVDPGAPQAGVCCGCCVPGRIVSIPQKRHLEKSEGELPSSFEQRVQVMLHRIGVTKAPATEGKKQQVGSGPSFGMYPVLKEQMEVVVHGMGIPQPGLAAPIPVPPLPMASVLSPNRLQRDRYVSSSAAQSVPHSLVCTYPLQPPQSPATCCPLPPTVPQGAATLAPHYQLSFPLQSKDNEIKKAGSDGEGPHPPHPDPHLAGHPCGGHWLPAAGPTTSPLAGCWWPRADPSVLMLAGGLCLQGTLWTARQTPPLL